MLYLVFHRYRHSEILIPDWEFIPIPIQGWWFIPILIPIPILLKNSYRCQYWYRHRYGMDTDTMYIHSYIPGISISICTIPRPHTNTRLRLIQILIPIPILFKYPYQYLYWYDTDNQTHTRYRWNTSSIIAVYCTFSRKNWVQKRQKGTHSKNQDLWKFEGLLKFPKQDRVINSSGSKMVNFHRTETGLT